MSKYCYNCGAVLEEGKPFCGDCGARQNELGAEEKISGLAAPPRVKRHKKARLLIAAGTAALVIIAAVFLLPAALVKDYERPVRIVITAVENRDYTKFCTVFLSTEMLEGVYFNYFYVIHDTLKREEGENFKIQYKIKDVKALTKEQLTRLADYYETAADKGVRLHMDFIIKGPKAEKTVDAIIYSFENDAQWYISLPIPGLPDNVTNAPAITPTPTNTGALYPQEKALDHMIGAIAARDYDDFMASFTPAAQDVIRARMLNQGLDKSAYMETLASWIKKIYVVEDPRNLTYRGINSYSPHEISADLSDFDQAPSVMYTVNFCWHPEINNQTFSVSMAELNGEWYILSFPNFLYDKKITDKTQEYDYVLQVLMKGLLDQTFDFFKRAFAPNYFNVNTEEESGVLRQYFDKNNYSADAKLSYKVVKNYPLPIGKRADYQNKYALSALPAEGRILEIEWTVSDGGAPRTVKSPVEIIKADGRWYIAKAEPFGL